MMSDVRYEIKTPLPVIWLENIDTKNPGWSVRNELTTTNWSVDDEDVEDSSTDWSSKRLTMRSKENGRILTTLIRSTLLSIITLLHYIWLAIWTYSNILMWSQINFLLSIRLTGSRQIDFKVSSLCCRNIFIKFQSFKIPKIDRVNFYRKSKQIFSQKINKLSSKIQTNVQY